jgi:hypothetical protein
MNRLSLAFRRIAAPLSGSKWWVWRLLEFRRTETSPMALFQGNHLDEEDGVHGHIPPSVPSPSAASLAGPGLKLLLSQIQTQRPGNTSCGHDQR